MDDILAEFLIETKEGLQELDSVLLQFERDPEDEELLSKIFRIFHNIKGSCGFIGLERLEKIAHRAEDILSMVREHRLSITPDFITVFLDTADRIKSIAIDLEKNGAEPEGDDADILSYLDDIATEEKDTEEKITCAAKDFSSAAKPQEGRTGFAAGNTAEADHAQQTLRVNVDLLEDMMTVVSELVLTRNQLLQTARITNAGAFNVPLQRLNHVVSELQESVMKTCMQPIGNTWSKLPRVVRDVCANLGKKIDLEMQGQETELDRQVLEMIKDPLMHMVRNALDHGIETPDERRRLGKPEMGRISLNAYHQSGRIIIQISDDGKGLSLQKIKGKAVQAGLVSQDQLEKLSPQQVQQFIFHAGFSTSDGVTSVSGRGVGMDIVRNNIQKIGGTVEIASTEGKGTTFTLNIPLTLAIVSALIVEASGERFALPQLAVSELVMVGKNSGVKIETVNKTPLLRLRENLLPLVYLGDYLKIWDRGRAHHDDGVRYVVVTRAAGIEFGLVVDHVLDMEEIVIKPVSRNLEAVHIFSGNTILGDGSVVMILDPQQLLQAANIQEDATCQPLEDEKRLIEGSTRETLLLLFKAGDKTPKAVPLNMVSRLREIKAADIELSNGKPVLLHLGRLMPVFSYSGDMSLPDNAFLIIFDHEGYYAGLIVDQVLDIAKYPGMLSESSKNKLLDKIILDHHSTDVVNPLWYMSSYGGQAGDA